MSSKKDKDPEKVRCDLCGKLLEKGEYGVRCKDCTKETYYFMGMYDS